MLATIAKSWEAEAQREDTDAAQRKMRKLKHLALSAPADRPLVLSLAFDLAHAGDIVQFFYPGFGRGGPIIWLSQG